MLAELLRRCGADAVRGTVGRAELGVLGLELLQLAEQAVVLGVRDLRMVEHVIRVIGALDEPPQLGSPRGGTPPPPPPLPPFTDPWLLPESRPSRRRPGGRAPRRWPAATAPRPTRPRARRRRPAAAAETRATPRARAPCGASSRRFPAGVGPGARSGARCAALAR